MTDDIKPPPAAEPVHVHSEQPAATAKSEAVATAPPDAGKSTPAAAEPSPPKPQVTKVKKPPKKPGNGVGLAIFATVIIVLGLAGLAVFAYIKTQK